MIYSFGFNLWGKSLLSYGVLLLWIVIFSGPVHAADTNAAPVQAQAPTAETENFPQYLFNHEEDLSPIFEQHLDDLVKAGLPVVLLALTNFILLYLLVGWGFDIGLSFGYAALFAPAYSKFKLAVIYATGRLLLILVFGVLTGLACLGVIAIHSAILVGLVIAVMLLIDFVVQTFWVSAIFRSNVVVSALFYLSLITVHAIASTLVLGPLAKARLNNIMVQFTDQNVAGQIRSATEDAQKDLADAAASRDKVKAQVSEAQGKIDQANAEQAKIAKEIEDRKNSEEFIYAKIAKLHAQGDLAGARDQLNAFLIQFPSGSLKQKALEQLAGVNSELTIQDAAQKQAAADAAAAQAQARADLLAKADKGEATLSELRQALIGKTRAEVTALFGPPTETGPDRWGYGRNMVFNPVANEKHGLTIYFLEGTVRNVDYYYGVSQ